MYFADFLQKVSAKKYVVNVLCLNIVFIKTSAPLTIMFTTNRRM